MQAEVAPPEGEPAPPTMADTVKEQPPTTDDTSFDLTAAQLTMVKEIVHTRIASNRLIMKQSFEVRATKTKSGKWVLPTLDDVFKAFSKLKPTLREIMREHHRVAGRSILITTTKDIPPEWKRKRVIAFAAQGEDLAASVEWLPEIARQAACRLIVQLPALTKQSLVEKFVSTFDGLVAVQRVYRDGSPSTEYELLYRFCPPQLAGREALQYRDEDGEVHNFMLLNWTFRGKCTMCNLKGHKTVHCHLKKSPQTTASYADVAGAAASPSPSEFTNPELKSREQTSKSANKPQRKRQEEEEIPLQKKKKSTKSTKPQKAPGGNPTEPASKVDPKANPTPAEAKELKKKEEEKKKKNGRPRLSAIFDSPARTKTPPKRRRNNEESQGQTKDAVETPATEAPPAPREASAPAEATDNLHVDATDPVLQDPFAAAAGALTPAEMKEDQTPPPAPSSPPPTTSMSQTKVTTPVVQETSTRAGASYGLPKPRAPHQNRIQVGPPQEAPPENSITKPTPDGPPPKGPPGNHRPPQQPPPSAAAIQRSPVPPAKDASSKPGFLRNAAGTAINLFKSSDSN